MVAVWLITLPASAAVGAAMWWTGHEVGGLAGALLVFGILVLITGAVYLHSRRTPVSHQNVNDGWDDAPATSADAEVPTATAAPAAMASRERITPLHNVTLALAGVWKVLLASLVLGAGLPALISLGVRALSVGGGEVVASDDGVPLTPPRPLGKVLCGLCVGVLVTAVAVGPTSIVVNGLGKTLSLQHVNPTVVAKH